MKTSLLTILLLVGIHAMTFAQESVNAKPQYKDTIVTVGEVVDAPINVISPPAGFDSSTYFNGYINLEMGASILMHELISVSYKQLVSGMNAGYYADNSMEFISKEELVTSNGTTGMVYKMRFIQKEVPFIRYVVHAGDDTHTLMIHVTYAEHFAEEVDAALLKSFNTIEFYPIQD